MAEDRLIPYSELKPRFGITYTRPWLRQLEAEGKFPRRVHLVPGGRRVGWWESEVRAHLERCERAEVCHD